ncbi:MAG: hypothetical protein GXO76_10755 [Calditrichaeota bacterium]|nr:hypothetical protein [Calditrichota bacterium]
MSLSIRSNLLQARFRQYDVTVGWRETKNFAAALHDSNPFYFDDERQGGISAPPTFPVALTWPIVKHLNEYLLGVKFPENLLSTMVHAAEHLILHRLVRPGQHLLIQTDVAAILPHKSGTQLSLRFRAFDEQNQLVFSEVTGALLRGVSCEGACKSKDDLPPVPTFPEGVPQLWEKTLSIDPLLPYIYDGCTNIVFPIHTSKKFAHQVGLPDILVQGTATLGLVVREIVNTSAGRNPGKIREIRARFSGMVFPGSEIQIRFFEGIRKEDGQEYYFIALNGQNQVVVKDGFVKIATDSVNE